MTQKNNIYQVILKGLNYFLIANDLTHGAKK